MAALAALIGLTAGLAFSAAPSFGEGAGSKAKVGATIFPLYDIARQVAGPVADVVLILPPGASPHTFEPTPAAVRALAAPEPLFVIGHGLDDWAARLARGAGVPAAGPRRRRRRVAARGRTRTSLRWIPTTGLRSATGRRSPEPSRPSWSAWLPTARVDIRGTLAAYLARLDAADREIRRLLDLPTRRIATFHDAFGYFAEAYGLEVAAVFEPYPGASRAPGSSWSSSESPRDRRPRRLR